MSKKHSDEYCEVPFCKECLENIKRVKSIADSLLKSTKEDTELEQILYKYITSFQAVSYEDLQDALKAREQKLILQAKIEILNSLKIGCYEEADGTKFVYIKEIDLRINELEHQLKENT